MSVEDRVSDLLLRWRTLRDQGQQTSAEELTRDCPELLDRLRERLRAESTSSTVLPTVGPVPDPLATNLFLPPPRGEASLPALPGYAVLQRLGQGGMGVVFKARHVALGRLVALKMVPGVFSPDSPELARLRQEARAMARLSHSHIVQIHDVLEHDGKVYLALEYLEGGSLDARLKNHLMPPEKAAELVATLAGALHSAHQAGVLHRDLKPSNVLLTADGIPKVGDFGLAKLLDGAGEQTATGAIVGTPSYMAPEQALGQSRELGPAVDVWALGAILYELLTGRPPFLGVTALETLEQVRRAEPVAVRQLNPQAPRDLETICLKCLEKDPKRRYTSAQELAGDLGRHLRHEPITARRVGLLGRGWRWCRRHPSRTALLAVSVVAVLVVVGLVLWFNRQLSGELAATESARRSAVAARAALHESLTVQVAGRLDADLRQLAEVARTLATGLAESGEDSELELARWMQALLRRQVRIFGLCVALEPGAIFPAHREFALYVYRTPTGLRTRQLLPGDYQPHYREWDWYRLAAQKREALWSEPYIGEGGDHTPMVTFSAPMIANGKFLGVVALDLSIDYFRVLRDRLEGLHLGPGSSCFLITPGGRFLYHPRREHEFPAARDLNADPSFRRLLQRLARQEQGSADARDPVTGREATFHFGRIPSAGWTFVVVLPDEAGTGEGAPP
jgi:hypothetical protein